MGMVIDAMSVSKVFERGLFRQSTVLALNNVSFSVCDGEILSLLGPSGAGKTVLTRVLMNYQATSHGHIVRFGSDTMPAEWETWTGYAPESFPLVERVSGRRILKAAGRAHGRRGTILEEDVQTILEAFSLSNLADAPAWTYSRGVVARFKIARALVHRPRLAILDNPMQGLDPAGRSCLKNTMERLREQGMTILMTSCEFTDVESIADRVIVLQHGVITAEGRPAEVFPAETAFTVQVTRDPLLGPGWLFMRNDEGWYSLVTGRSQLELLLRALTLRGITPAAVSPVRCAVSSLFSLSA